MRFLPVLLVLLISLAACRGTQPYTSEDLRQVRQGYAVIPPIYRSFKRSFAAGDTVGVLRDYRKEQAACHVVDKVDNRDTIDPNLNLFAVSAGLDSLCNDIESAYADWAKKHHYPYDKSIVPGRLQDVFVDGDANLKKMPKQMRRPGSFA